MNSTIQTMRDFRQLSDVADWVRGLSEGAKLVVMMVCDVLVLVVALSIAYWIRMGIGWFPESTATYVAIFISIAVSPLILHVAGLYRLVSRYVTAHVAQQTLFAVTLTTLVLVLSAKLSGWSVVLPRTVIFMYWFISFAGIYGVRVFARWLMNHGQVVRTKQIAIFGAREAGHELSQALKVSRHYRTVAFIDDDPALWGRQMGSATIISPEDFEKRYASGESTKDVEEIFIALPSESRDKIREVTRWAEQFPQRIRRLPPISELTNGEFVFDQLVDVSVEDVVGRDSVPPDQELLEETVKGLNVLVTGAGGSIGSEICRQALLLGAKRLVLYENSENHLYQIDRKLREMLVKNEQLDTEIVTVLGSVVDGQRILSRLEKNAIDTVFHAAAYKHVPLVESNPSAGLSNNCLGTAVSAIAAREAGVRTFVLVSTDKAVRPTNVMGASKRLAEMLVQLCADSDSTQSTNLSRIFNTSDRGERVVDIKSGVRDYSTRYVIVRFGNVLDSSGSVIPLFREQILKGGPVTVTHPEVNRFFMSIPEAAELVIQAGALGSNGEVHLLDMGEPVKIVDLATRLIRMSGYRVSFEPSSDPHVIEVVFSGLRPGEKLYEELLIGSEAKSTRHPRIFRGTERDTTVNEINELIPELLALCDNSLNRDPQIVRDFLSKVVDGYTPEQLNNDQDDQIAEVISADELKEQAPS